MMGRQRKARLESERDAEARALVKAMLVKRSNYYASKPLTPAEENDRGTYAAWAVGALTREGLLVSAESYARLQEKKRES